jgi:hypothetical protein
LSENKVQLSRHVCERGAAVDWLSAQIEQELLDSLQASAANVEQALPLQRIAAELECLAGLAINLGKEVIFRQENARRKHYIEGKK